MSKRKTWVGRVYLGRDAQGRQQFDWVGRFKTRRERDDAVAARRVELARLAAQEPRLPTCDEYADRYLREYARTHKGSSLSTAEDALKRFRRDFAGRRLDVPRAEAKDWANGEGKWKTAGRPPASSVFPVVTLYNYAIDEDDLPIDRNPFRGLGERSKGRAAVPPPTEEEFDAILGACDALGAYAPVMRAFLRFAAFTLMRPSEMFALEWADIDFEAMRIAKARRVYRGVVDTPKSGAKTIALPAPARDALLGLPRDGRYVFTSKTGRRLSSTNMWGYWSLVRARAGVDFDLYLACKHYGVWYMWTRLGMSPRSIAAQAGWSLRSMNRLLEVYGHGDVGALEEVDRAFAASERVVKLRKVEG